MGKTAGSTGFSFYFSSLFLDSSFAQKFMQFLGSSKCLTHLFARSLAFFFIFFPSIAIEEMEETQQKLRAEIQQFLFSSIPANISFFGQ